MTEIVVSPAPPKPEVLTLDLLEQQIHRDLGRVSNLLGFDRQQREELTRELADHPFLLEAWEDLQDAAKRNKGSVPIWIRNKIVGSTCFRLLDEWLALEDHKRR
jgi:hypothetical protein